MTPNPTGPDWLTRWRRHGVSPQQALAAFDALGPVEIADLTGPAGALWAGAGLRTGHPLDGVLEALGWYGKAFRAANEVDPLLFWDGGGRLRAIDPARLPVRLGLAMPGLARSRIAGLGFAPLQGLFAARGPTARLRRVTHRGVPSAAMIYDQQPIIDHFRKIDDDRLLGLMDMRGMRAPFFFVLGRAGR